jgi:hypothetical protein
MLTRTLARFSGVKAGPYNPYRFREYQVPRTFPSNQEIKEVVDYYSEAHLPNVRNVRHVNPVRQSGPLPSYSGTYTMEDIRKVYEQTSIGNDFHYCQVDVDELMRRVPGLTRKEAEHIGKLGLSPMEQVDFAYLAVNIGLDVFFEGNQMHLGRQVVTNSKGEKVEVFLSASAAEDIAMVPTGFAPNFYLTDHHWEIFLWGDVPIKATNDIDLSVPNTWFEYELEATNELNLSRDQVVLQEDIRPFATPKNPHCSKELWKSQ